MICSLKLIRNAEEMVLILETMKFSSVGVPISIFHMVAKCKNSSPHFSLLKYHTVYSTVWDTTVSLFFFSEYEVTATTKIARDDSHYKKPDIFGIMWKVILVIE